MSYAYYSAITIDHTKVSADETNFPIVVVETEVRFKTVANGGHIQNTDSNGGASGSLIVPADLVFSPNTDGSSPYDFEIEDYDASTGKLIAHVEIPSLSSSTDTTIYVVYGDSGVTTSQEYVAGVWDSNYKGVWHLSETSGTHYDSTSNNCDGTNNGSTQNAAGKIAGGNEFDGSNDEINIADLAALDITGAITIEAWVDPDSNSLNTVLSKGNQNFGAAGNYDYFLGVHTGVAFKGSNGSAHIVDLGGSTTVTTGTWHHIAGAWDGTTGANGIAVYLDGSNDGNGTATNTSLATTYAVRLGGEGSYSYSYDGHLDEVRISNIVRDADWISTTYNNQNSPSTFYTLGSEQSAGEAFVPRVVMF